jgi:putative ABC transport system permease protein
VTIVGVAERTFVGNLSGGVPPAIWLTLGAANRIYPYLGPFERSSEAGVYVVGRLQSDTSLEAARAELSSRMAAGTVLFGPAGPEVTTEDAMVGAAIGAVMGLVLLLACVNVANLLLASATTRRLEIGARLALGASRGRIVRQLLSEGLLLGGVAGALGLLLTMWLLPLARLAAVPATIDVGPDVRVYAFVVLVSLVSGAAAGLAPARYGTRGDLASSLQAWNIHTTAPPPVRRLRGLLVGTQAAASVLLLALTALLMRTIDMRRCSLATAARPSAS